MPKQTPMRLHDVLTTHYFVERDLCQRMQRHLTHTVNMLGRWLKGDATTADLTADTINAFLAQYASDRKPKSVNNRRAHLLAIAGVADSHRRLLDQKGNEFTLVGKHVRKLRVAYGRPVAWSVDEIRELFKAAGQVRGFINLTNIRRSVFFQAWVAVAFDTGLRPSDMRRVRFTDINKQGVFFVAQKKTGKPKWCHVRPATHALMDDLARDGREFVFGGLIADDRSFRTWWRRIIAKAGLEGTAYCLRRSSGTAFEALFPGQGHSHLGNNRAVFEAHYLDAGKLAADMPSLPTIGQEERESRVAGSKVVSAAPELDPCPDLKTIVERFIALISGSVPLKVKKNRESILDHVLQDLSIVDARQLSAARVYGWLEGLEIAPATRDHYRHHLVAILRGFSKIGKLPFLEREAGRLKAAIRTGIRPDESEEALPLVSAIEEIDVPEPPPPLPAPPPPVEIRKLPDEPTLTEGPPPESQPRRKQKGKARAIANLVRIITGDNRKPSGESKAMRAMMGEMQKLARQLEELQRAKGQATA